MKPEDIQEGKTYIGSGACCAREVDFIIDVHGRKRVHWFTPNTLPVKLADGRRFHTPNRTCSLKHFARWAKSEEAEDQK